MGIEGTGRLSSRCLITVELALLLSSFNSWCYAYSLRGKELPDDQRSCAGSAASQLISVVGLGAEIRKGLGVAEKV